MFGCIGRLGCLLVLIIIAVCAWLTRDRWMSRLSSGPAPVAVTAPVWEPLTSAAAEKGRRAIESMSQSSGPVYENMHAGEVASYVFQSAVRMIPSTSDSAEAAVIGDALYVRAIVPMKDIAGSGVLGPLAGLLNDHEKLSFGGTFHVIKPGLSEFQVREIKLRDFKVPTGAIPRLLQQINHGTRPAGVAADAIPVTTPKTLGDVRIANHLVTLYKTPAATTP